MKRGKKIRIKTPSRLHFGLIDLNGALGRVDGGIGIALDRPGVVLHAEFSKKNEVAGNITKERAGEIKELIEKTSSHFNLNKHFKITVEKTIPAHVGLGGTTQLYLAAARAITDLYGLRARARELAICVSRGGTSGIGVGAFEEGGLIVDFGHSFGEQKEKRSFQPSSKARASPPQYLHFHLPEDWYFVCAIPDAKRVYGSKEIGIFERYCPISRGEVEQLCHLLLMKILPSAAEGDITSFGEGLNQMQNLGFKKVEVDLQRKVVKNLMTALRQKAFGAGLSSFGPTVYALAMGRKHALNLKKIALEQCEEVIISRASRSGAIVTSG